MNNTKWTDRVAFVYNTRDGFHISTFLTLLQKTSVWAIDQVSTISSQMFEKWQPSLYNSKLKWRGAILIVWLWRCNLSNSVAFQPDVYLVSSKTSGKATRVKLQIFVVQLRPVFQRQEYKSFPKLSDFLGPEAERLHATSPEVRRCSTKSHLDDTMATFLWMVQMSCTLFEI